MKAIKFYFLISLLSFSFFSCQDDEGQLPAFETDFVRFHFFVDNNSEPLIFPQRAQNIIEQPSYDFQKRDTLRIPVALTSRNLQNEVIVNFENNLENIDIEDFDIFPSSKQLVFSASRPSDTIYLIPKKRFTQASGASIEFQLTESNQASINLGYPRENNPLDNFIVNILPTAPIGYTLANNPIDIRGEVEETHQISVLFDQLVNAEEIAEIEFLTGEFAQFACDEGLQITYDFEINKQLFQGDAKRLNYEFKILQDIQSFSSNLNISLIRVDDENFSRFGNALLNISKTVANLEREGDIAQDWYNVSSNFHLTYGRSWYFNEADNECRWRAFQAFTRPVEVAPGSEFDNGQGYHKYKISFRNIIANPNGNVIGTNPFNFRRYYDGASALSPAYNLSEAIEFFPNPEDNGATGAVSVISQTLVFFVGDDQVQVPICGTGSYQFNADLNTWEMFVTIVADETEINGNASVEKHLFIYSSNVFENPDDLDTECSPYIVF